MIDTACFGHMVYFSLRDNSSAAVAQLIAGCQRHLSDHPGTLLFAVGTREPELNRDVNVKDYDVALQLVFSDRAAHDAYQIDSRHAQFIAENKDNWATVRVYDAHLVAKLAG